MARYTSGDYSVAYGSEGFLHEDCVEEYAYNAVVKDELRISGLDLRWQGRKYYAEEVAAELNRREGHQKWRAVSRDAACVLHDQRVQTEVEEEERWRRVPAIWRQRGRIVT